MIDAVLASPHVERLGWVLVHSLWQMTLIGSVAWILGAALRRASPEVRYWCFLSLLACMAAAPVATWAWLSPRGGEQVALVGVERPATATNVDANLLAAALAERPADSTAEAAATERQASVRRIRWLGWLVAAWAAGAAVCAVRPLLGWRTVRRLQTVGVSPVPDALAERFRNLVRRSGASRAAKLLQSALVKTPVVVGWLKPVVLLPLGMCSGMPIDQIEAILLHELAHVRRRDFLVNAMQTIVETVLFHHPAVWLLSHRIRCEREFCCDDLVVRSSTDRGVYGRALLALAEIEARTPALAMASTGGLLVRRVERILGVEPQRGRRGSSMFGAGLVAAALLAATLWLIAPSKTIAADEEPKWGAPSNGLAARAFVVSPDADEQSPEKAKPAGSGPLKRAEDLTLVVELRNQSGREIAVQGVRYGDTVSPPFPGKSSSEHFAPCLFDCEFVDAAGRAVDQPRGVRLPMDQTLILSGGSAQKLAPNTTLAVLIRPCRWSPLASSALPSGDYRVRIRYRGAPAGVQETIRKRWPQLATGSTWTGDAAAVEVPFRIARPAAAEPAALAWGEPVKGLRAAVEFRPLHPNATPGIPQNSRATPVIHIQNVGEKVVSFWSETNRQGDETALVGADGRETVLPHSWYSGWPIMERWTLKPGQTAAVSAISVGFASDQASAEKLEKPVGGIVVGPAGDRRLLMRIRLGAVERRDAKGKKIVPADGDWTGQLATGAAKVLVRDGVRADEPRSPP